MRREVVRGAVLVLGVAVIIASMLFTLTHLVDNVVFTVLLPGVVVGLMLIGVYVGVGKRDSRRRSG
jgi:membrane protease YdiL (CAAX protease family)